MPRCQNCGDEHLNDYGLCDDCFKATRVYFAEMMDWLLESIIKSDACGIAEMIPEDTEEAFIVYIYPPPKK